MSAAWITTLRGYRAVDATANAHVASTAPAASFTASISLVMSACRPDLLDLEGLNTSRQVVETLDTNDRVGQPRLAEQLFTPCVVITLRVLHLQILKEICGYG